jgi:methenyltetrahydrofolate cyclohydrolase
LGAARSYAAGCYTAAVSMHDTTVGIWLEKLAGRTPTPGGGAAAALSAATAAALVGMVTNYTTGGKWADREARMRILNGEAATLRTDALRLADEDEVAFASVGAAYALPKQSEAEQEARRAAIEAALTGAADPPARTGAVAARVVELAAELVESANPNVLSDVAVAAELARAAIESAIVNVDINRRLIRDEGTRAALEKTIGELAPAVALAGQVAAAVRDRLAS